FRAIINPPQCAIISVGAITRRPVEGNQENQYFTPIIEISLTADHRIVDGAYGARFLEHFKDFIEQPVLALA
ncbi:MAG TPA: 2-oxo acid dehydrogenase subunit E2, partial [Rectinema sp.]|nr:2-oxo acid dehydrogenase subunit E2 [Rectinema sp.]